MKISSKLNELKPVDLNCNVFDVYSYDGLSMQELLCQFFTKINECINVSNETIDLASWLVNEGLKIEVVNKLMIWLEDGTLENLINVNLFNTLNTKIDNINSQFEYIAKTIVVDDIDSTTIKSNDKIDVEHLRMKQVQLFNEFSRKLRLGENTIINFQGDSLTYGYEYGGLRGNDNQVYPDGSSHDSTKVRSNITYPEATINFLNSTTSGTHTMINRGYTGIYAQASYNKFFTKHNADVTILMLGTNDSRNNNCPYKGDVETYLYWMEQIIIRELLWDKAVVLLTPPRTNNPTDLNIDVFGRSLKLLSKKYCIPLLDTKEVFKGHRYNIYSDVTHFNEKGYMVLGSKCCSFLLCQGVDCSISNGSNLMTRPQNDNIIYKGENAKCTGINGYQGTTDEYLEGYGIIGRISTNEKATYTFYTNEDNLVVLPSFSLYPKSNFKITLNHNTETPPISSSSLLFNSSTLNRDCVSSYSVFNEKNEGNVNFNKKKYIEEGVKPIIISQKGYQTLTIEADNVNLFNIEFISLNDFIKSPVDLTSQLLLQNNATLSESETNQIILNGGMVTLNLAINRSDGVTAMIVGVLPETVRVDKTMYFGGIIRNQDGYFACRVGIDAYGNIKVYLLGDVVDFDYVYVNASYKVNI